MITEEQYPVLDLITKIADGQNVEAGQSFTDEMLVRINNRLAGIRPDVAKAMFSADATIGEDADDADEDFDYIDQETYEALSDDEKTEYEKLPNDVTAEEIVIESGNLWKPKQSEFKQNGIGLKPKTQVQKDQAAAKATAHAIRVTKARDVLTNTPPKSTPAPKPSTTPGTKPAKPTQKENAEANIAPAPSVESRDVFGRPEFNATDRKVAKTYLKLRLDLEKKPDTESISHSPFGGTTVMRTYGSSHPMTKHLRGESVEHVTEKTGNFAKIEKSAEEEYGSKEAGLRVAGAIKAKMVAKKAGK